MVKEGKKYIESLLNVEVGDLVYLDEALSSSLRFPSKCLMMIEDVKELSGESYVFKLKVFMFIGPMSEEMKVLASSHSNEFYVSSSSVREKSDGLSNGYVLSEKGA